MTVVCWPRRDDEFDSRHRHLHSSRVANLQTVRVSAPGQLMMPLSFAALISGMLTLVATAPNLVVNGELERHGIEGFRFFSFTPFGLPILALGIRHVLRASLAA